MSPTIMTSKFSSNDAKYEMIVATINYIGKENYGEDDIKNDHKIVGVKFSEVQVKQGILSEMW